MKTINMLMLVMAVSAVLMPVVLAQETASEIETSLDGSVSGMELSWKQLGLAFTFNQERKAEKELEIARLRLIQAKVAAMNNNTIAMEKALEAHDKILNRVHARINAIDGKADKQGVRNSVAKFVALEKAIEVHEARIAKLSEILESKNLTDEQMAKVEEKLAVVQDNTEKLKELQERKKEQMKTRLMAVTEMTEEEADAEIQKLEDAENLAEVKKIAVEVKIETAEKALEKLKERVANAEEDGKNVSAIQAQIAKAEQRISEAKTLAAAGNYSAAFQAIKPVWNYGQNIKSIRSVVKSVEASKIKSRINSADSDEDEEEESEDSDDSESGSDGSGNSENNNSGSSNN